MIIEKLSIGSANLLIISGWMWEEWGQPNNRNYWDYWVSRSTNETDVPQTFIAREQDIIIGTVSLWRCDLQSCQDIFPWLGGLYIIKDYRGRGYAKLLVEYASVQARTLGYKHLYLYTELDNFFEKIGWRYIESVPNEQDIMVKLYEKVLK